ncbi:MAG: cytidylate kinase-like family protein [Magnetococcales bacterium]|nr:cytidylate kinase-like family protein [Magnetococcales bacterium]
MTKNSLEIIQTLVNVALYQQEAKDGEEAPPSPPAPPLVTLSRGCGAGGAEISELLAERLGVHLYDRDLLKAIVKETKADKHLMERLDERVPSIVDDLVLAFFAKKSTTKDNFYRYMVKVILNICPSGGVIVGRGAHLLIPQKSPVFRVRIEGSSKACIKRVAKRKELKKSKAAQFIEKVDAERAKFVKRIRKRYPTVSLDSEFDMVLSTDRLTNEQAVAIIASAMKEMGFNIS